MDARTNFFYGVTGITPGMAMRLTGIGSQYLLAMTDADKNHFDGAKTYKVTLPKGIPEANFWSFTLYDNMTRSMLDTPQRYPRAGSQSYPSPAAEASADGSTTIYFGPTQPDGREARQLDPDHAGQGLVHDPAPLQPARAVLHQGVAAERDRAGAIGRPEWRSARLASPIHADRYGHKRRAPSWDGQDGLYVIALFGDGAAAGCRQQHRARAQSGRDRRDRI